LHQDYYTHANRCEINGSKERWIWMCENQAHYEWEAPPGARQQLLNQAAALLLLLLLLLLSLYTKQGN
jgi:hypothetical protein